MKICIIGGGASGLYLAAQLDGAKHEVHLYEGTSKIGRKYLVAGKGGFNLSKNQSADIMTSFYEPPSFMQPYLMSYDVNHKRSFLESLGVETYVGSSGKIFPVKGIKPYQVLKALENRIVENGVHIHYNSRCTKIGENRMLTIEGEKVSYDKVVCALGGASWSKTGSDGAWTAMFRELDVKMRPFEPSNCRVLVDWTEEVKKILAGKPLKNISVCTQSQSSLGEALITEDGIEGGAIYAIGRSIRQELKEGGTPSIYIDLKPSMSYQEVYSRLNERKKSVRDVLRKHVKISDIKINLLSVMLDKAAYHSPEILAKAIKKLRIPIREMGAIETAISTSGGIALEELDTALTLKKNPDIYCIGEMLDWDTITGGYLLQACYSLASRVAYELNNL